MSVGALFRRPSGFLPVTMSSIALLLFVARIATVGVEPQTNEGMLAPLWQLLMLAQLPLFA
jgi:hypothetical protein